MKTYQVRHNEKQVTAAWTEEGWIIDGTIVPLDEATLLKPFITTAQVWEWYGDEDHVGVPTFGRYKSKGGEDFIVHLTEDEAWDETLILGRLNAKLNVVGQWMRYEFNGELSHYWEPKVIEL